jgi:hypothetical protein
MRHRDTCAASETPGETMTETVSLKALARLVLERDGARDGWRDRLPHGCLNGVAPARQSAPLRVAPFGPVTVQSERVMPIADGEPGLEQPCAARRGRVQVLDGAFLHFCVECGRFAAFGCGVRLRAGQLGRWYCGEHRPTRPPS